MNDEIETLRKRVHELENLALEYTKLQNLIEYAAQGGDLSRFIPSSELYVDPITGRVVEANDTALDMLGYSRKELFTLTFDQLGIESITLPESNPTGRSEGEMYEAVFRDRRGHEIRVNIHRRIVNRKDRQLVYYRLGDKSLHRRLWHELQRREDAGFQFQQKMTILNEITVDLSRIEAFDDLCCQVIHCGIERLGFDRMGLWLVDTEHSLMHGTYGVDEKGNVRAEHGQQWSYIGTQVSHFINGTNTEPLIFKEAPIFNDKSEIIDFGWQLTVPVMYGNRCIATLATDNYLRNQPIRSFEPELLRLYGITVAHLMELIRSREQALALRVAQERTRMLRDFITNIGHDFRTPLSTIKTGAYLLQRIDDPEKRGSISTGIQQQVTHISSMVDNMLEFIRLQHAPTLTMVQLSPPTLINAILKDYGAMFDAKRLQVVVEMDETLTLSADLDYLHRAFSEIVKNAIQYTLDGGWIHISTVVYEDGLAVRVQDSGIGMDQHTKEHAFDPLFRGDEARTERRGGFGLTIAKAVIEAHGGRIRVESAPGQGSLFEMLLPL